MIGAELLHGGAPTLVPVGATDHGLGGGDAVDVDVLERVTVGVGLELGAELGDVVQVEAVEQVLALNLLLLA